MPMNENLLAFFVPSMRGGGAERVMLNLAVGLQQRGLNVDMVLAGARGPYLDKIPPEIRIIDLGVSRVLTSLPGLVRYLKKQRPLGLISAMGHTNIVSIWARWLARTNTRIIVTVHNTMSVQQLNNPRLKRRLVLLLERLLYSCVDAVVAVSRGVADDMIKMGTVKSGAVEVIYNPIITPYLEDKSKSKVEHKWLVEKDKPVLIAMGRLSLQKNFWNLLRAFKLVLEQRSARLIILGEGKEQKSLEDLVAELGIGDDVDMPGFVDNPYSYLANADMFVLSSDWEGLPTVLVEALAVGTPVVSTDCPSGPREILQQGRYGRLVQVGNSEMLAEAIVAALDEPRKPMDVEELRPFTLDAAVDAYLSLLRK